MDDPVAVIGGGLAGLACAAQLARSGCAVELLDAGAELGGRAGTSEHEGFLLNQGAHALYPSSERLLAGLGVKAAGRHPKPGLVLRAGELIPSMFGPGAVLSRSPLNARERRAFLSSLAAVTLGDPAGSSGSSAAEWAGAHGHGPFMEDLLGGLMRLSTYCGDASALPAELGRGMLREAVRRPVRYLDGGWRQIVEALAARARAAGAVLHSGVRVSELRHGPEGGFVLAGAQEERRARAVVLAGLSPARAARLLRGAGGGLPQAIAAPRPVRAACLDIALSELPRPEAPFVLGLDEPLYLSAHSAWSQLTPGTGAVVHLLRYEGADPLSGDATLARLEALMDQVQPGWRERVVHRRFLPRMVVVHHLPAPGEGLALRPGVRDSAIPGVFLAGDWVGAEGWLAGASLRSGLAAAGAVLAAHSAPQPARTASPVAR